MDLNRAGNGDSTCLDDPLASLTSRRTPSANHERDTVPSLANDGPDCNSSYPEYGYSVLHVTILSHEHSHTASITEARKAFILPFLHQLLTGNAIGLQRVSTPRALEHKIKWFR